MLSEYFSPNISSLKFRTRRSSISKDNPFDDFYSSYFASLSNSFDFSIFFFSFRAISGSLFRTSLLRFSNSREKVSEITNGNLLQAKRNTPLRKFERSSKNHSRIPSIKIQCAAVSICFGGILIAKFACPTMPISNSPRWDCGTNVELIIRSGDTTLRSGRLKTLLS